ncbi:MAG: SIS domain-containing protein [Anaerolineae bacterium]
MNGEYTWSEIQSQGKVWPAAWHHAIEASERIAPAYRAASYSEALFIGCGSTHYLALSAAALANEILGLRSRGLPSSEVFLFPRQALPQGGKPLLVAISRSGETTETIKAVRFFRERFHSDVLTIGNYPEATLVKECDDAIIIPEGQEQSIAQTRSFASMLLAAQVMIGTCAGNDSYLQALSRLPDLVGPLLSDCTASMKALGTDSRYDTFIFLGSGAFYGVACEAMLKMKEMSLSHSEAFHYLEFRHGPKSIVNKRTLIAALLSDSARDEELRLLAEMRQLGASVLLIGDSIEAAAPADYIVDLQADLPETARVPLCLPPLQVFAHSRAIAKGLDPDQPTNLSAVVVL